MNDLSDILDEKDPSAALKLVQLEMSKSLSKGVGLIYDKINRLNNILDSAIDTYINRMNVMLQTDTIETGELLKFIDTIQSRQLQIMDLYRKIVQGRTMFQEALSEEEKTVIRLLNSFKSPEEKHKFLLLCEKQLESVNEES